MVSKSLVNYLSTSRRFEGGLLLNILGYHILRILMFRIFFLLRRKRKITHEAAKKVGEMLEKDGLVILPNFFPEHVFLEIRDECYRLELEVFNERAPRMLKGTNLKGEKASSQLLKKYLGNNETINKVVSNILRKDILVNPGIEFSRTTCASEDIGKPSTETADNLHFDMSFPTIKCFYYVNEITEDNAALMYVRGSHKMTFSRMCMEYVMGIKFWLWSKKKRAEVTPEVSLKFVEENGMKLESAVGGPNTLVIANTMGFHRRGEFSTTTPRELVYVNFRTLDTLSYLKKRALKIFFK